MLKKNSQHSLNSFLPLVLFSALSVCFLFLFSFNCYALEKEERDELNVKKEGTSTFVEKRHVLGENNPQYSLRVHYPSFGAVLVDTDIATWVHQRISFFQEGLKDIPVADPEYSSLIVDYTVSHTSLRCISLLFTIKTQTGSPNVEEGLMTATYQAQEGRRLALTDIFAKPEGIINFLSQYCRRALIFRDWVSPEMVFIYQGTTPHPVNFMFFTITSYGLDIHFPPNHIASAFEGTVTVSIPMTELAPFAPKLELWGK